MLGALEQGLEGKAPLNCQIGWMGIFHSEDLDGFHDTPWMKVWGGRYGGRKARVTP